jgi:Flp pilus assembly protein TadB
MHPKVFSFALHCSCFVSLFAFFLLIVVDIISLFTVALATALPRRSALEAELKTATEALKDANTSKVSAEKAAKAAETRAKKAEKALAEANQKQTKREQDVVERLDEISTSVGSKCFILSLTLCYSCICRYVLLILLVLLRCSRETWRSVETSARKCQRPSAGPGRHVGVKLETCSECPPANSPCLDLHVCRAVPEEEG